MIKTLSLSAALLLAWPQAQASLVTLAITGLTGTSNPTHFWGLPAGATSFEMRLVYDDATAYVGTEPGGYAGAVQSWTLRFGGGAEVALAMPFGGRINVADNGACGSGYCESLEFIAGFTMPGTSGQSLLLLTLSGESAASLAGEAGALRDRTLQNLDATRFGAFTNNYGTAFVRNEVGSPYGSSSMLGFLPMAYAMTRNEPTATLAEPGTATLVTMAMAGLALRRRCRPGCLQNAWHGHPPDPAAL